MWAGPSANRPQDAVSKDVNKLKLQRAAEIHFLNWTFLHHILTLRGQAHYLFLQYGRGVKFESSCSLAESY